MFYKDVKAAWQAGKVRVGLPAHGGGKTVSVEASGWLGVKAKLLSKSERALLANASITDAQQRPATVETSKAKG